MNTYPYFTEIEEAFIRRRGAGLFLSPKDWALMDDWQKRDVPLHIVIRSVEQVFDGAKDKRISSLAYCNAAVQRNFADWQTSQVGASPEQEKEYGCTGCFDQATLLVPVPEHRRQFSFEMEEVPCPDCVEVTVC